MKTAAQNRGELHQKLFPAHKVFIHPKFAICLNCRFFHGAPCTRKAVREYRSFVRKNSYHKPIEV